MEEHHIEHRYERRVDAVVGVEVWRGGQWLGRFRTRNLCREGMFIETGNTRLRPSELVRVVLRGPERSCETLAMVVHQSERGVGVTCAEAVLAPPATPAQAAGF